MLGHHGETLVFLGFFFSFLWFVLVFGASSYFIRCVFLSFCFEKRKEVFSFFFLVLLLFLSFFLSPPLLFLLQYPPLSLFAVVSIAVHKKKEREREKSCCVNFVAL